jgi:hypothetical protein
MLAGMGEQKLGGEKSGTTKGRDCGGSRVVAHLQMWVARIVASAHLLSPSNRDRKL